MSGDARRFRLVRTSDPTGVSGTGVVADGVQWPDGTITVRWRGERPSTVVWQRAEDAIHIHGHAGSTQIEWLDDADAAMAELDPATVWIIPKRPVEGGWLTGRGTVWIMTELNADELEPADARDFAAKYLAAADAAEATRG